MAAMETADLVLGTSLEVYPVNQLPSMTRGKNSIYKFGCDSSGYTV